MLKKRGKISAIEKDHIKGAKNWGTKSDLLKLGIEYYSVKCGDLYFYYMKLGSLFSGGGLGDFGFMAAGMDITWQCEIDEYCQKILALRYPESKKYRDIKTLKGAELEPVDIITGGFPCQPPQHNRK